MTKGAQSGARRAICVAVLFCSVACETNEVPVIEVPLAECGEPAGGWSSLVTYVLTNDIVYDFNSGANRRACFEPTVSAVRLDGRGHEVLSRLDPSGGRQGIAIRIHDKSAVEIFDMSISNFNTGIQVVSANQVIIHSSAFRNNFTAISIADSRDIRVEAENSFLGYDMPDAITGIGIVAFDVSDTHITDNSFGRLELGLDIRESTETSVTGNEFTDDDKAMFIVGGMAYTVAGNQLQRAGGIDLRDVLADTTVSDNEIVAGRRLGVGSIDAIRVEGGRAVSVRENTIRNNELNGIVFFESTNGEIADNEVINNTNDLESALGIALIDSNRVSVTGNVLSGNDFGIVGGGINPLPNAALSERNFVARNRSCANTRADLDCWRLIEMQAESHGNLFGTFNRCLGPDSDPDWPQAGVDYDACP